MSRKADCQDNTQYRIYACYATEQNYRTGSLPKRIVAFAEGGEGDVAHFVTRDPTVAKQYRIASANSVLEPGSCLCRAQTPQSFFTVEQSCRLLDSAGSQIEVQLCGGQGSNEEEVFVCLKEQSCGSPTMRGTPRPFKLCRALTAYGQRKISEAKGGRADDAMIDAQDE